MSEQRDQPATLEGELIPHGSASVDALNAKLVNGEGIDVPMTPCNKLHGASPIEQYRMVQSLSTDNKLL